MSEAIIVALITGVGVTLLREGLDALKHKRDRKESKEDSSTKTEARIKELETEMSEQKEMDKMMLKGIMLITGHLVDGNHTDKLREYEKTVEDYLIER